MTDILMIDDNHCSKPVTRGTAHKYVRLAAFGMVWAVVNMIAVDTLFDRAFNERPFQIVTVFNALH
jgi:hypothetical protein